MSRYFSLWQVDLIGSRVCLYRGSWGKERALPTGLIVAWCIEGVNQQDVDR
jgi:hypothetical protein